MGSAVLAVTGAEALYADMGHFGRSPIRISWLVFVLPALVLNYLGQASLLMRDPAALREPVLLPRARLVPVAAADHRQPGARSSPRRR